MNKDSYNKCTQGQKFSLTYDNRRQLYKDKASEAEAFIDVNIIENLNSSRQRKKEKRMDKKRALRNWISNRLIVFLGILRISK